MYNCSLEISALNWANHVQCAIIASNKEDVGENLFEVNIAIPLKEAAEVGDESKMFPNLMNDRLPFQNATKLWAEGISNHGISSLIRPKDDDHIGSGTQVLWAETHSVGCGAINCRNGHTMVICHYFPRGNSIGAPIYKAGKTLSECGLDVVKEVPHKNTGLCVEQTEEGDTSSSEMEHKIDEIGDLFGV
ncbi:hypothetical protein ANCCEY_00470 [Ancylostoma ceylanicum]|uniref:SCP domain-containing protein n=1 Tax=Ancylostoma ceylanicum TaxID=53326 RepID=A0A0D6MA19_9BILA|nr:hypothetical protein ANCCEY_00470 [Ancylostoma ceylanicum]